VKACKILKAFLA